MNNSKAQSSLLSSKALIIAMGILAGGIIIYIGTKTLVYYLGGG